MFRKTLFILIVTASILTLMSGCGEEGPAQTATVIGSVADINLNPIVGATVVVGSTSTTTISDGSFILERLLSGTVTLSVSAPGYISVSKTVELFPMKTTNIGKIILETRDSKSTDVDIDGGNVLSSDGKIVLTIPSGALSSTSSVTVTNCNLLSSPAPLPDGYNLIYLIYISPKDVSLLLPATLSIPLPTEVPVYFFRYDSTQWLNLGEGKISSDRVEISISKFGWFAAAVKFSSYGAVTGKVVSTTGSAIAGADVIAGTRITVTDTLGTYTITNLPVGTLTIQASKTGYSSNSINVMIKNAETTTASNIVLSPLSSTTGTISGKVLSLNTSSPIPNARVVAQGKTVYTDSRGDYTISGLSIGNVTVDVYAYGYLNDSAVVNIPSTGSAYKTFRLQEVSVSEFYDDFESDKGWAATGLWNRVDNTTLTKNTLVPDYITLASGDDGSLPQAKSGSHTFWFGKSDTGSYINQQLPTDTLLSGGTSVFPHLKGDLVSPSISLIGFSTVTLSFWSWWEVEGRNPKLFDKMEVKISIDNGSTWTTLLTLNPDFSRPEEIDKPYSSAGYFTKPVWVKNVIDLTPYAGKNIRLCFSFDQGDLQSNGFRGWFIDDVTISKDPIAPSAKR